jgi:hypothetical protein
MNYSFRYIYDDYHHKGNRFFVCDAEIQELPRSQDLTISMTHAVSGPLVHLWEFISDQQEMVIGRPLLFEKVGYPFSGRGILTSSDGNVSINLDKLLIIGYSDGTVIRTNWTFSNLHFSWKF